MLARPLRTPSTSPLRSSWPYFCGFVALQPALARQHPDSIILMIPYNGELPISVYLDLRLFITRQGVPKVLSSINSAPFYCTWIKQPTSENPTDVRIVENPKFTPFFDDCVGALDGTQIRVRVLEGGKKPWRNRYAYLSTNTLAACDFSLRFVYVRAGYKGSGNDQNVFNDAMTDNVIIPKGRFYLADAGYGVHPGLRVPYRGVRYHLKEWGKANTR